MKLQHILVPLAIYMGLHWLMANGKLPEWLLPLAKQIEARDLTYLLAEV